MTRVEQCYNFPPLWGLTTEQEQDVAWPLVVLARLATPWPVGRVGAHWTASRHLSYAPPFVARISKSGGQPNRNL